MLFPPKPYSGAGVTTTRILPANPESIEHAAMLIANGYPVGVPTETVYGLAGDASSGEAVAAIYAAKGRPSFNPLIAHVRGIAMAERIAIFSPLARKLAVAFWPGPLTMVLPRTSDAPIASLMTAGLPTIAVRAPSHPIMRALIAAVGRPLAAPSANASGGISATSADHVAHSLGGRIELVLDGGPTEIGIESTIVAVEEDRLRLLRPGCITIEMLREAGGVEVETGESGAIEAPGQMSSHYAPSKPVRLDATRARPGEVHIGFGAIEGDANLSERSDLKEAASRLFDLLHIADATDARVIAVAPIPDQGLGLAINDRLRRAAAPR